MVPSLEVAVVPSQGGGGGAFLGGGGFVGHAIIRWKHGLPLKKSGGDRLWIGPKRRLICDSWRGV